MDQEHLQELHDAYQQHLNILEVQEAKQGLAVQPHIPMEIARIRERLAELEQPTETNQDMAVSRSTPTQPAGVTREEFNALVVRVDRLMVLQMISMAALVLSLVSFILTLVR